MGNRIDLDVAFLERQIDELVYAFPEMAEDESLRADMVEGQLNVEAVMSRVVSHLLEADMMISGMAIRFEDLTERKKRWERRKDFCRSLAQRVLEASGRPSIQLPEATISKTAGKEGVEITDLDLIPQGFHKTVKEPMKAEIKKALDAGDAVPGAALKPATPSITVRKR